MAVLRSLLFALVFYGGTVPAVLLSFPISLFGTQGDRRLGACLGALPPLAARAILLGIRTQVEGAPPAGACLVAGQAPVDVRDAARSS